MAAEITWRDRMMDFPCAFNLQSPLPTRELLQHMKQNVSTDKPTGKYCKIQETRNKNVLTWIEYLLDPLDSKAKEINDDVMAATGRANIPSLGNRIFILYGEGNDIDAEEYLNTLVAMNKRPDFEDLMTEAKAEQAYYYSRMGGFDMSVQLFQEVVTKKPLNLLWKYGLGLMYRRMTNSNVCYSVTKEYNLSELISLATGCLLDVTRGDDRQLRGLAYTQLIVMFNKFSKTKHAHCFQGLNGNDLFEKALEDSSDNSTVLCHCSKYFLNSGDVDKAIELLEKSLSFRSNSIAFHYLGMCYERKAEKAAKVGLSLNDQRSKQNNIDKSQRRTRSEMNNSQLNINKETDDPSHASRQHSMVNSNSKIRTTPSFTGSQHNLAKKFLRPTLIRLDQNCGLVKKSAENYEEAIKLSKKGNVPSILSLGKLYQRTDRFKEALQQFRQIINLKETKMSHLVTLITAYEEAGICLLELSEQHQEKSQVFFEQGKEYLTKAISLAADLASMKSGPKGCKAFVWKSLKILKDDIDRMDNSRNKGKEKIFLLKLLRDYRGIVTAIEDILKSDTELDDTEMVLFVNSYLIIGEYENALAFVNMVTLTSVSCLKETGNSACEGSETKDLKAAITKVFLFVAWQRFQKQSSDAKRIFQKLFATKYREFAEIQSEKEDEDEATRANILIVNDTFQDCEEGLGQSTQISKQLQLVFSQVCGFRSFINLQENVDYYNEMEVLFQEMKNYPIVLIVLTEEKRDTLFDHMLQTLPEIRDDKKNPINVFIIQSSERVVIPDTLLRYKQQGFTLLQNDPILSITEIDECLDVTNSSDIEQGPAGSLDVTNSSDIEQGPAGSLDVTNPSDTDQRRSACLDGTYTSEIDQRPSGSLDVTNPSDSDQRPTECLDATNRSDTDQRPTECLDVTNPSDTDQRPTECLDATNRSDTDQRPTECLDATNRSDTDQRPTECLDATNSSDTDHRRSACLDVTYSSEIDQRPSGSLDATNSRDTEQRCGTCLDGKNSSDTDQELNPQCYQNDVITERIISLVCFLLHLDFNQLKDEYSRCKN